MDEKIMAPWKKELFTETGALDEAPRFQEGVIAGYHDAGVALATGKVPWPWEVEQWAAGFVQGYRVRLEIESRKSSDSV